MEKQEMRSNRVGLTILRYREFHLTRNLEEVEEGD